jgi:hypothetical protein
MQTKEEISITPAQMAHLERMLGAVDTKRAETQNMFESGIILDMVEAQRRVGGLRRLDVREALGLPRYPVPRVFTVKVRVKGSRTLKTLLDETGCESVCHDGVDVNQVCGSSNYDCEIGVFHFGKGVTLTEEEALDELRAYGYRPVKVEELLALSAHIPGLQRKFPIAGIGCTVPGGRYWMIDSPHVVSHAIRPRRVGLFRQDPYDFYRIAAVRDLSLPQTKYLVAHVGMAQEVTFEDSTTAAMKSVYGAIRV